MRIKQFSAAYLHKRLNYNPITGELRWNACPWIHCNEQHAGKLAGSDHGDYSRVTIGKVRVMAHHVIWKMTFGEDPEFEIDHKDWDGRNNALSNLRAATHSDNTRYRRMMKNNVSGETGVWFHKQCRKWQSCYCANGKNIHTGLHATKEAAKEARDAAARKVFGEFFPGSNSKHRRT